MSAPTLTRPRVLPQLPTRPSRLAVRLLALGITLVVLLAFWSVEINWGRLVDLPSEVVRYLWLMFSDPDWSKLPEALWQTWRSVAMAWIGTVLGVLIFATLTNLFVQNNLDSSVQAVAKGAIIIAAVLLQQRFSSASRT